MMMSEKIPTPEIAVARALIRNNRSDDLLVVRRSDTDSHAAGLFEFPGGKIDPGETADESTLREIKEETNLDITLDPEYQFLHKTTTLLTPETSKRYPGSLYSVTFRSASLLPNTEMLRLSEEHSEARWTSPLELLNEEALMIESRNALVAYIKTTNLLNK